MKRLIPILVLAALGTGAYFAYRHYRAPDDRLVLSGSIEARTVEVGSLLGGRVSAVAVAEGATVRRGQTLVTFEPDLTDL